MSKEASFQLLVPAAPKPSGWRWRQKEVLRGHWPVEGRDSGSRASNDRCLVHTWQFSGLARADPGLTVPGPAGPSGSEGGFQGDGLSKVPGSHHL